MWLDKSTVCSPRRSRMSLRISTICTGSRPEVGSSRMSSAGLCTSACASADALAVAVRQRADDLVVHRRERGLAPRPRARAPRRLVGGTPRRLRDEGEVVADGHLVVERRRVGQKADALAHLVRLGADDRRRRCVTRPAVGKSTQPSTRSVVDLPAPLSPRKPMTSPRSMVNDEIADGRVLAVILGQPFDLDHVQISIGRKRMAIAGASRQGVLSVLHVHVRDARHPRDRALPVHSRTIVTQRRPIRLRVHRAHRQRRRGAGAVTLAPLDHHRRGRQGAGGARRGRRRREAAAQAGPGLRVHELVHAGDAARIDARNVSDGPRRRLASSTPQIAPFCPGAALFAESSEPGGAQLDARDLGAARRGASAGPSSRCRG